MANEMDEIRGARPEYLTNPFIGRFKVTSAKRSESDKDYRGRPYFEFRLELENGLSHTHRMWRNIESDAADKRKTTLQRIRMFLVDIGVDVDNAPDLLQACIGKTGLGAFGREEYIGKDKNTGRPEGKSSIKLFFVNQAHEPFGAKITLGSLVRNLKPEDTAKLQEQQRVWDEARARVTGDGGSSSSTPAPMAYDAGPAIDPLPFGDDSGPGIGDEPHQSENSFDDLGPDDLPF